MLFVIIKKQRRFTRAAVKEFSFAKTAPVKRCHHFISNSKQHQNQIYFSTKASIFFQYISGCFSHDSS